MPLQLHHRVVVIRFQRQVAVLGIALKEPSFIKESGYTVTDSMDQRAKSLNIWSINSVDTLVSIPGPQYFWGTMRLPLSEASSSYSPFRLRLPNFTLGRGNSL